MLLGMIVKICNLKKFCRTEESKNLIFDYCFLIFFPTNRILKIGIYTHLIDLSCHQKFEKFHRLEVKLVVIKDYECVRRRNFNTDTLNDFPI